MKRNFSALSAHHFDLLVCGGGIYGAWTAYDAALRGLRVAIVEQDDWANGTSSASSKLIHGGLRYLETFDFKLVRKALRERSLLLHNAPHRVWPLRFGVPLYAGGRIGALRLQAGLLLYDLLAGWIGRDMRHRRFSRSAFAAHFPALSRKELRGGYTYADAQTDDARMVLELIAGALQAGAVCVNHCKLLQLVEQDGKACGALIEDQITHTRIEVSAAHIVNTSGAWEATTQKGSTWCRLTKGIHLILPTLGHDTALLLTAPADGRVFFIIPWYGRTLLGATDTDYRGDVSQAKVAAADIAYLLASANYYLKTRWTEADVLGSYAGLRVLKKSGANAAPSSLSRDWELQSSKNGVLHSIGGKLTSAREDAARIVDEVCARSGLNARNTTANQMLPWTPQGDFAAWVQNATARALQSGVDAESALWLLRRHGKHALDIFSEMERKPELAARILPDLPLTLGDLLFCARHEMVMHLPDLLRRRMPLLILARLDASELQRIGKSVAPTMGWDEAALAHEMENCCLYLHPSPALGAV